ncbi:hypothetical protein HpMS107_10660 [Helicobacter pylori]|jgi:hypothetical protein|nr:MULTISPECIES: hypothetical protein [Cupriavidus]
MPVIRVLVAVGAAVLLAACAALDCGADGGNGGYEAECSAEIRF